MRLPTACCITLLSVFLLVICPQIFAADFKATEQAFHGGHYDEVIGICEAEVEKGVWNERWSRLLIKAYLETGKYQEASKVYDAAIKRYNSSMTLRLLGIESHRRAGHHDEVTKWKQAFETKLIQSPSRYVSRDNLLAIGRYFVERNEDARKVLKQFYDRVGKADPKYVEGYIATTELALAKNDFEVAAETIAEAEPLDQTDPRVPLYAAMAWASSKPEKATAYLQEALKRNPNHAASLIYLAEQHIDAEKYAQAIEALQTVLSINPNHSDAWALLAVLDHIDGHFNGEKLKRAAALAIDHRNPHVDHLIGRKLSDKYRFAEGAAYQRSALKIDPSFQPAQFQLSQDLLRLGENDEGWKLAESANKRDPYNVVAFNLMTLKDRMSEMVSIERDGIILRMDAREAIIYGDRVFELLREAKEVLSDRYEVSIDRPVVVEIFPSQNDFAIRTFGLPGGSGYLGVCFGRVITANSPASQGENPSNWQSVLWHEFAHTVTLEKTANRMPRWLSEGISVYEERTHDTAWGESMTPRYRRMILDGELTPIRDLSGAFLNPKSPMHLQFAYYQASLVVEHLIQSHGFESLLKILEDLHDGYSMDDALIRNTGSPGRLQGQFEQFARGRAEAFGGAVDWSEADELPEFTAREMQIYVQRHPRHFEPAIAMSKRMLSQGRFQDAVETLEPLRRLGAVSGQTGGVLDLLARAYRGLKNDAAEEAMLREQIRLNDDALASLLRLVKLDRQQSRFDQLLRDAEKFVAVHPLRPEGHVAIADASQQVGNTASAVTALLSLGQFDQVDPAKWNLKLATAYEGEGLPDLAKHYVLRALDEAPRYDEAQKLLLRLVEKERE